MRKLSFVSQERTQEREREREDKDAKDEDEEKTCSTIYFYYINGI